MAWNALGPRLLLLHYSLIYLVANLCHCNNCGSRAKNILSLGLTSSIEFDFQTSLQHVEEEIKLFKCISHMHRLGK
jgi:hypothetical protein